MRRCSETLVNTTFPVRSAASGCKWKHTHTHAETHIHTLISAITLHSAASGDAHANTPITHSHTCSFKSCHYVHTVQQCASFSSVPLCSSVCLFYLSPHTSDGREEAWWAINIRPVHHHCFHASPQVLAVRYFNRWLSASVCHCVSSCITVACLSICLRNTGKQSLMCFNCSLSVVSPLCVPTINTGLPFYCDSYSVLMT